MAYKKKNKGATLVVNQEDNILNFTGTYFNKWVSHRADLKENKTKIIVGYNNHVTDVMKPVKWRDKWLQDRYIHFEQEFDNKLWCINFDAYGIQIHYTQEIDGVHIGEDYRNINKAKFMGKLVSKLNNYLKQEKDNAIILHPKAEGNNTKLYMIRPDILPSCFKTAAEENKYLRMDTTQESYEYAQNIYETTQGKEPDFDDLPF